MKPISFFKKAMAIFILWAFMLEPCAHSAQTNPSPPTFSVIANPPKADEAISIPAEFGKIDESFAGKSGKTIIYIQDAHDSLEAQENIAKIIHNLVERYGVKTIFEEGYEGPVPTDKYFGFIKDAATKEKVSYFLLDKLRLGGAEYAHINRRKDFKLIGADSIKLHLENIARYRESAKCKKETEKDLQVLDSAIEKLANRHFPKGLKEWMKLKARFEKNEIALPDYLRRTAAFVPSKAPRSINLLLVSENSHDPVLLEKTKLIDPKVLFQEIERMENDLAKKFLDDEADQQIFQHYKGINLLKRLNDIEMTPVEYEVVKSQLQNFSTQGLAQFIVRQTRKSIILSKRWEENIQRAVEFYEISRARDSAIAERLNGFLKNSNEKVAVLVFGGFHKEHIQKILKNKQFSYLVASPKITSLNSTHQRYYKTLMSLGHHPFEVPFALAKADRPPSVLIESYGRSEVRAVYDSMRHLRDTTNSFSPDAIERNLMSARAEVRAIEEEAYVPTPFVDKQVNGKEQIYRFIYNLIVRLKNEKWEAGKQGLMRTGFYGLQGSGKSTITSGLSEFLTKQDQPVLSIRLDWFLREKSYRNQAVMAAVEKNEKVQDEGRLLFDLDYLERFFKQLEEFDRGREDTKEIILENLYNRETGKKDKTITQTLKKGMVIIIEGTEALRREFLNYYDATFVIDMPPGQALKNSLKREKEKNIHLRLSEEVIRKRFELFSLPSHEPWIEEMIRDAKADFLIDMHRMKEPVLRELGFRSSLSKYPFGSILAENEIQLQADILRRHILESSYRKQTGHIGGAFSMAEVLSLLYFGGLLHYDFKDSHWRNREKLVVSEGHIAPVVYATLASAGFFSMQEYKDTFKQIDSRFQGHLDMTKTPGVDASTGSLGEGLSIASGIATVNQIEMNDGFTYVVMGDGDSQEGQHDEAARFASAHGLNNIIAVLNFNGLQYDGGIAQVDLATPQAHKKLWQARGWNVVLVRSGHDAQALKSAFDKARLLNHRTGHPTIIITETKKGKGVSFMEDQHIWHGKAPNEVEYRKALGEIDERILKEFHSLFPEQPLTDIESLLSFWERSLADRATRYQKDFEKEKQAIDRQLELNRQTIHRALAETFQTRIQKEPSLKTILSREKYLPGESEELRNVFGIGLVQLARANPGQYLVTTNDVGKSVGTGLFQNIFGTFNRYQRGYFVPAGIRESHMASWGYGVALAGKVPVLTLFENFSSMFFQQIKPVFQSKLPMKIIVTHTGLGLGGDGKTHQSVVEAATYHQYGIPVFEPFDPNEALILLSKAFGPEFGNKPVFLRLTRQKLFAIDFKSGMNYDSQKGFGIIHEPSLKNPQRVITIVASGATVHEAIEASRVLETRQIKARIVAVNQLHQADPTGFLDRHQRFQKQKKIAEEFVDLIDGSEVYTVQDAAESILRQVVASALAMAPKSHGGRPIQLKASLGINAWGESGTAEQLYAKHGLDSRGIIETILAESKPASEVRSEVRKANEKLHPMLDETIHIQGDVVFTIRSETLEKLARSEVRGGHDQWLELLGLKMLNEDKLRIVIDSKEEQSLSDRASELLMNHKKVYLGWGPRTLASLPKNVPVIQFEKLINGQLSDDLLNERTIRRINATFDIFDGAFIAALRYAQNPSRLEALAREGMRTVTSATALDMGLLDQFFKTFAIVSQAA